MKNDVFLMNNLIQEELRKYYNKTTKEIQNILGIDLKGKNANNRLFKNIIENSKDYNILTTLMEKGNYEIKTVNLEWNNNLKESMSLRTFEFIDIFNESWKNSTLRNFFASSVFIFVVSKKDFEDVYLESVKFWSMPINILENEVKKVWEHTKKLITTGNIVSYIDSRGRFKTNFLTSGSTKVIHVRPHARNKDDTFKLPVVDVQTGLKEFTKHSFWINSHFIKRIIVDGKHYE